LVIVGVFPASSFFSPLLFLLLRKKTKAVLPLVVD